MVDQLSSFADEVTRVAREVGTDGKLGGQAQVKGVAGTWRDLTESVSQLASNLTGQVRNIAQVTTAVARGDLSQKITVDARGDPGAEVDGQHDGRPALLVRRRGDPGGPRGGHRGQARRAGAGAWGVGHLAGSDRERPTSWPARLTTQLRAISAVSTAVARGDLTQQIQVAALGEVAELKDNINQMIAALRGPPRRTPSRAGWTPTSPASGACCRASATSATSVR